MTDWSDKFLPDRDPVAWRLPGGVSTGFQSRGFFSQQQAGGLEVVLAEATTKPSTPVMRSLFAKRRGGRVSPVLCVVGYPTSEGVRAALCGPVDRQPVSSGAPTALPVLFDVELSQVERIAASALEEPEPHSATRYLLSILPELDPKQAHGRVGPLGLRNSGLLATQELRAGVPKRSDWSSATKKSKPLLKSRGRRLVERLGFEVGPISTNTWVLTVGGYRKAVAIFCDDHEPFDVSSRRFGGFSPASLALAEAHRQNINWVILTRKTEIRLYTASGDKGVGNRGRTETFVEIDTALLPEDQAGYLHLLFSSEALGGEEGSLEEIVSNSKRFATDLAARLRERVYHETVPILAKGVAARLGRDLGEDDLARAFEQVMVILFRLLFVAYAEDRDLLPYRTNSRYANHSLTRKVELILEDGREESERFDPEATDLWDDISQLWGAVNRGNTGWGVPAYNGGLFTDDPEVSPSGADLAELKLTDAEFGPALAAMLIDDNPEGQGPVDFRSLSVREFGTIYEGLLESKLSVAMDDLAIKVARGKEQYVPASAKDNVEVEKGSVYFHNRSGVRKSTGSYFTKPFAVEHLLDHALEPALDDHLGRLEELDEAGDEAALANAFFDFRCADIAMGSGHFLVAAVDRIEARLSEYLTTHSIPRITAELERLRDVAYDALGDLGRGVEIETSSLLRRQIARHCIYGVDKNRVAVELARLAVWVHTFVPGLPLSLLDRNLIHGDSLTGIGTLDEVVATLDPDADPEAPNMFRSQIEEMLARSKHALKRYARTSDASTREIVEAREAHYEARQAVFEARSVFDVVTAIRADACRRPEHFDPTEFIELGYTTGVRETVERLMPVHFPADFPEVFLRDHHTGFDCVIGNPPWEKVVVDREIWWGMHLPGVRSLPVARRRAKINALEDSRADLAEEFQAEKENAEVLKRILRATFPRLGSGQTDYYKAFAWANLSVLRPGGHLGLLLPRSAVTDKGMANWRMHVTDHTHTHTHTSEHMFRCGWRRSSITNPGCSREFTTPTQWRWWPSPDHHRGHLPQHPPMGLRRGRRSVHRRIGGGQEAQSSSRASGVALRPRM